MAKPPYDPVGACIYCGASTPPDGGRFGDEHIIAYALAGELILPHASCDRCARIINSEIESPILLREWIHLRIKMNFPTRSRRRRNTSRGTHVSVSTKQGGLISVPIAEYPCPVPVYYYNIPRIISGEPRNSGRLQFACKIRSDKDAADALALTYPEWDGTLNVEPRPIEFARMLAKIAYSYAVATYGLLGFIESIRDIILGRNDDVFLFVGGTFDDLPAVPGGGHNLDLGAMIIDQFHALLIVDVRIFSQLRGPIYTIVVGKILFDDRDHLSIFRESFPDAQVPN